MNVMNNGSSHGGIMTRLWWVLSWQEFSSK